MRSSAITGSARTATPCGCASHSAKLRIAVTHSPASTAASSKRIASQPRNAAATASRSYAQPSNRNTPSR